MSTFGALKPLLKRRNQQRGKIKTGKICDSLRHSDSLIILISTLILIPLPCFGFFPFLSNSEALSEANITSAFLVPRPLGSTMLLR